jgi:hypothetical protein
MSAHDLSQMLTTIANGVTAFAAVQNFVFSYHVANGETMVFVDRAKKYWVWSVTLLFDLAYVASAWWSSSRALSVLSAPDQITREVFVALTYGRCVAIVACSLVSLNLVWRLDDPGYWAKKSKPV